MTTSRNIVLKCTVPLLLLTLLFTSCKKDNDTPATYNGFKIDGVVYSMDTLERDFAATAGALRIQSNDNGGGMVYIRRGGNIWPTADGIYDFSVQQSAYDTNIVRICFERDGMFEAYCSISGPTLTPGLRLTIANGKWALSLLSTKIMDNTEKTLEISASE